MRKEGLSRGRIRGRRRKRTTRRGEHAVAAAELLRRDFTAAMSDRLWTADITYDVDTEEGFLYLAFSESFVATLKAEPVGQWRLPSREAAKTATFEYLESFFYNRRRLHSSLGYTRARWTSRRVQSEKLARRKANVSVLAGEFHSYSPDSNPIEEAFSKIKALVRKEGARVREALDACC